MGEGGAAGAGGGVLPLLKVGMRRRSTASWTVVPMAAGPVVTLGVSYSLKPSPPLSRRTPQRVESTTRLPPTDAVEHSS